MFQSTIRRFLLIGFAAAMVLSSPSESHAICGWLRNLFAPRYQQPIYQQPVYQQPVYQQPVYQQPVYQQPVYQQPVYQPVYAAPVHDPCATPAYDPCGVTVRRPTVCQYVPQTCYRTQYVNVPITTYQPVAPLGGWTGRQSTGYRPVTTYGMQARLVPYTTYHIVYRQPAFAAPIYYPAPAAVYGNTTTAPMPAGPPASMVPPSLPLSPSSSGSATGIPHSPAGTPAPYGTQKPITSPGTSGTPNKANANATGEKSPSGDSNGSENGNQPRIQSGTNSGPQLGAPDNRDEKTAARPWVYRAVSASVDPAKKRSGATGNKELNDTGWRPSSR